MKRASHPWRLAPPVAAILALAPMPLMAQAVVQPITTPNADRLAAAMKVLATAPKDAEALMTAGEANIRLDDPEAALQFFQRAETVAGTTPRITAGRAAALVALERPGEAMLLFRQAQAAGYPDAAMALDRGLAYDLLGYSAYAQRDYRLVLNGADGDEATRRLAMSLGISGEVRESEAVLLPLLQRNDRAAWRVRAFVLAMNGQLEEANRIAAGVLPGFAPSLAPFFARLPAMNASQRAHAVHFGQLDVTPQRVADAALVAPLPPLADAPRALAAADGEGDDRRAGAPRRGKRDDGRRVAAAAPPPPSPPAPPPPPIAAPPPPFTLRVVSAPPVWTAIPPTLRPVELAPSRVALADAGAGAGGPPPPGPAFTSVSAAPPAPPPPAKTDDADGRARNLNALGAIVASLSDGDAPRPVDAPPPAAAPPPASAGSGDDFTPTPKPFVPGAPPAPFPKVAAASPPPAPVAKPAPAPAKAPPKRAAPDPAKLEPARIWVQVAGGADESALPATWARLAKQAPQAFRGQSPWTVPVAATNRLLAGPFANAKAAQTFVNQLSAAGIKAFTWTSTAGQKITKLKAP